MENGSVQTKFVHCSAARQNEGRVLTEIWRSSAIFPESAWELHSKFLCIRQKSGIPPI